MNVADSTADGAGALLDLIDGKWTTQAIGVAAELGIADLVAAGTRDLAGLGLATACDPAALERLLRALESLGICRDTPDGIELTARGAILRSDSDGSLRSWAIWSARYHWTPWGALLESVRAGASSRPLSGTGSGYAHLEADPHAAATFNGAMAEISRLVAAPLCGACDLSAASRIVDVGGGSGELLIAILSSQPKLSGVLLDLPHAVGATRARGERSGLAARCEIVGGSFFDAIPPGCDVHLLKAILHNWDDERCRAILGRCRGSMPDGGRLLLVERVVHRTPQPQLDAQRIARSDLNMLVSHAGRERTLEEYAELLDRSGFRLAGCTQLRLGFSVIDARPIGAPDV
jgi:hypothetical protein